MGLNERDFFPKTTEIKPMALTCPKCGHREDYKLRWIHRTKKDRLPAGADERDRALFNRLKDYLVRAEIRGAKKDDIRVTVDRNFVSISAEVRKEKEDKSDGGRVLLRETYYGSASRGFSLASEIDEKAVVAKLEDGVLKLTLPKRASAAARSIAIE